MSRGLGIEQRNILLAAGTQPLGYSWGRSELQQAAWGIRRPEYKSRVPEGCGTHRWIKNVKWWRNDKQLTEGNFTRALQSLERRGLLVAHRAPGCHTGWTLTVAGVSELERLEPEGNWHLLRYS